MSKWSAAAGTEAKKLSVADGGWSLAGSTLTSTHTRGKRVNTRQQETPSPEKPTTVIASDNDSCTPSTITPITPIDGGF